MTGFKLRHATGTLLQYPFASATAAVIFAETNAARTADQYKPEPIVLPCSCGLDYVQLVSKDGLRSLSWGCPLCRTTLQVAS